MQYPVGGFATQLASAGQAPFTLTNLGAVPVWIDSTTNLSPDTAGIVLQPRQSTTWDGLRPLYAITAPGQTSTLGISDGTGMSMSPVVNIDGPVDANISGPVTVTGTVTANIPGTVNADITGPVSVTGPVTIDTVQNAVPIATKQSIIYSSSPATMAGFDTGDIPTNGYNTIVLTIGGIGTPSGTSGACYLWVSSGGAGNYYTLPVSSDFGSAAMVFIQVPVTGQTVRATVLSIFGNVAGAYSVTMYGLTQSLPAKFETRFMANGAWSQLGYANTDVSLFQVAASSIADYTGPFSHISGAALLNCYCGGSGVFAIKPYSPSIANIWAANYTGGTQLSAQIFLPDTPLNIYFRPSAAGGPTATFTVVGQHR